jgi:hypothetical protein
MKRRQRARDMAGIVELRDVQRRNAEIELASARDGARRAEDRRAEAEQQLASEQRAWEETLSLPSLSLPMVGLWGDAVHARQAQLERLAGEAGTATDLVAVRARACATNIARLKLAREVGRGCERTRRRHEDEAALTAFEDRLGARIERR